ncbi:recombinase family protein [Bradyrhizobium sp. AUGA SZCCT0222]|uniref:recombinase family protein n=1 Tax=Bradyrhizobium sp. AUGA SZCCT0222 TaxID=2807668 RepID=UPI001BA5F361|nr:recombinase family protein [Bradyrhizobium sp. AUGA SZCCT0222]MBR1267655.1 recombinase family protein [Bradyrhizobium sp. AUGA SZCCT0222]
MAKKIKKAPGWLGLSEDRTSFVYIPERAEIVRQIFELSIAGLGGYTIAKLLNSKKVPAFGTSKRWDQSTIHNMLSSRATIGEYQRKQTIEGKEHPVGDPEPGYYPPVIQESLFQAAQEARQRNLAIGRGRKGRLITNLFAGLTTCAYCNSPVKFHSNGNSKSLICKSVVERTGCIRFGWSYGDFENSFFEFLNCGVLPGFIEQLVKLRNSEQEKSQDDIYTTRAEISRIVKAGILKLTIATAGVPPPSSQTNGSIRRDHPNRCFTAVFADGSSRVGYPVVLPQVKPNLHFNSIELSKSLLLTPRQGALTTLLAQGDTLTIAAEKLGMTLATARWHLREIFKKTNTHSQVDLVRLAETTFPPEAS